MPTEAARFLEHVKPALESGNMDQFVKTISSRWTLQHLCEFLHNANVNIRRVAAVSLGFMGDRRIEGCLFRALRDQDRQVNQMAEHSLWSIWFRQGRPEAIPSFQVGMKRLEAEQYAQAIAHFQLVNEIDPDFAEAYNQRAIAHYFLQEWDLSIKYCRLTLRHIPMHFGAIAGIGHGYAQLNQWRHALSYYRQALRINPQIPAVASAIEQLQARFRDSNDASGLVVQEAIY